VAEPLRHSALMHFVGAIRGVACLWNKGKTTTSRISRARAHAARSSLTSSDAGARAFLDEHPVLDAHPPTAQPRACAV
jgi:hypothetical protein